MSSSSVWTDCWKKSTLRWSKLFYRVEAKTSLPCRAMRLFYHLHMKELFDTKEPKTTDKTTKIRPDYKEKTTPTHQTRERVILAEGDYEHRLTAH